MLSSRRIPWMTLLLLLGGYTILGHFLAEMAHPRFALGMGTIAVLNFAFLSFRPLTGLAKAIYDRLQSSLLIFSCLTLCAGLVSVLLNWLHLFLPIFMIVACELLARLDLKTARTSKRGTYLWLVLFSWTGLILGWFAREIYHV